MDDLFGNLIAPRHHTGTANLSVIEDRTIVGLFRTINGTRV